MKAIGVVRRIDNLGRVVIPKEIRKVLSIKEGDPIEFFTEDGGFIVLKKYESSCIFCGEAQGTLEYKGKLICKNCLDELTSKF